MHIATEAGNSDALRAALTQLGFKDDNLAARGLIFDPETAQHYTSCPLIDVHASIKIGTHEETLRLEDEIDELMKQNGVTGYWHSEFVEADEHIEPLTKLSIKPLPFSRLSSRPRNEKKKWDIHLSFQEDLLLQEFKEMLISHGLYYLARIKNIPQLGEKRFAVFTVQGVNRANEGRRFYSELCTWLREIGAPSCDIKLEITTGMELYNFPRAIPPTVSEIPWK